MQDNYMSSSNLVDLNKKVERPTNAVLTQGGWRFCQVGTYTLASPLAIADGVKTKLLFNPVSFSFTDGRNFNLNYNTSTERFMPQQVGDALLVNLRLRVKPSAQAGTMDITLESPTVAFNPIMSDTKTFNKSAGTEHFMSSFAPIFISADVVTNGLEVYIKPLGTNLQVYDISIMVSKLYNEK